MYTSYFGFRENPFSLTPDPNYLYFSRNHKEAFDHLLYGINERKGFIVITGGIGTGKTTLCRALLDTIDSSTKTALIFNAYVSDMELLRTINQEFGIGAGVGTQSKKDYVDSLNEYLLETFSRGGNSVLLIDEAQNLSRTVLEQIRMLSNLETEKEKLVQIVLAGQTELREFLASPSLRQLNERIMVRYDLKPLDKKEVQGYVEHRLVVAGGKGNLRFTKGAHEAIYAYSQGNPRRINGVCDRALLIAYSMDEFTISRRTIQKAIDDIRGDVALKARPRGLFQKKFTSLFIPLLLVLIIAAGFGGWNYRKEISALISGEHEVSVAQTERTQSAPVRPRMKEETLFLDEQTSLAGLFRFFYAKEFQRNYAGNDVHLGLYSTYTAPEHYIMFKKPFRVCVDGAAPHAGPSSSAALPCARYLLIRELTADGAMAINADGEEQPVTRDFILTHWGQGVSWVYPYKNYAVDMVKGMRGLDVIKLQQTLKRIGYSVGPTGLYDEPTFDQVMRFQGDFGLIADGIAGTRTKGLLYQMSE
ncbi:MAG: hypothetical protein BA872_06885 [Desulfobacterales bacterium C00003060]|nr:MAG: hypothetical protein BA861_08775 [Desulfobacterales bacterium S3730MH5]OEU79383.1 MAG: hypothetical protein BA872_06885 [Desulfobacterales bacterium C00003060]